MYKLYNYITIQYIQTRVRRQNEFKHRHYYKIIYMYQMERKHTSEIVDRTYSNK